jgi:hypothetical protein
MERSKGLQYGELGGQISCDQWFSMLAFSQFWVILAVWARKAFSTPAKSLVLCLHILYLRMVCLHYIILKIGSFPMSVANNFCDQPLPKYMDSKTVLIYCPHPVELCTSIGVLVADVTLHPYSQGVSKICRLSWLTNSYCPRI